MQLLLRDSCQESWDPTSKSRGPLGAGTEGPNPGGDSRALPATHHPILLVFKGLECVPRAGTWLGSM